MWTCKRLDLESRGSWPPRSKNFLGTGRRTLLTTIAHKMISEIPHTTLNIIKIHDNVTWDWQYYVEYSHIQYEWAKTIKVPWVPTHRPFTPWTMKSSQGLVKICDWQLNLSWDHFGLHPRKKIKVTMEFKVPKILVLRPTLSTDMAQQILWWERQKRCSSKKGQGPLANKCCYHKLLLYISSGEKETKTREWSNLLFFFSKLPFLGIY